jgi:hypothetical protein
MSNLLITEVMQVQAPEGRSLGLDRLDEDKRILAFARFAEAKLRKWLDFAKGCLLFLMVPGDPESGMFYIYDRRRQAFYMVDIADLPRWGGYREDEFDQMAQVFGLKALAADPRPLRVRC